MTKNEDTISFGDRLKMLRAKLIEMDWTDDGKFEIASNPSKNYTYVTADKVKRQFNACLSECGLEIKTTFDDLRKHEAIGSMSQHWTIRCTMELIDPISLQYVTYVAYGEAGDSGDKGVNKAQTDAIKQIIFSVFLIADNSDPEGNSSDIEAPSVGRRMPPSEEQKEVVRNKLAGKAVKPKDESAPVEKKEKKTEAPVKEEPKAEPKKEVKEEPAEQEPPMNKIQKSAVDRILNDLRKEVEDGLVTAGEFDAIELEAQKLETSRQASEFIVKHRRK